MLGPLFYVGHANSAQFRSKLIKLCHPMQTLANWPPKVPGRLQMWAHLQGNTLIIARDKPLPEEGSHSGKAQQHPRRMAMRRRTPSLSGR